MGETAPLYSIIQWLTSRVMEAESENDDVPDCICKRVTSAELIEGGRKAMEAEFQLSEYRMPGLDGMELWRQHAENTAHVLKLIREGLSVGE